jgi:hypothetical protein
MNLTLRIFLPVTAIGLQLLLRELLKGRFKKAAALLKHNWQQGLDWVEQNYVRTTRSGDTA